MMDTHGTSDNLDSMVADHSHSHEEDHHHHHHILTQYSHLFSIGIQTALAITIHKVPEGFLTFASNHADRQVGLNVFIALSIHNFSEGFSVAFPLFLALKSRAKAFLIATLLCGISQPIGALLAMLLFKHKIDARQTDFVFGIIVSVTAGFMAIIGMQMYGTSIYYGSHQWAVTTWFVVGMVLIGATTIIMP
jgi:ZIP family zinc transporter